MDEEQPTNQPPDPDHVQPDETIDQTLDANGGLSPASAARATQPSGSSRDGANQPIGQQIGPYQILSALGEGGMGAVYLAEQREPVLRRVALKIIKVGMDSDQVIARFEAERQALALMDHANIAKVLDAGTTESGRPFFVMELVDGMPITQFCDEHKLGIRQRLELFGQVCHAVQHAHQKGIIHRDLKPSNILVGLQDDHPIPKVIDFGLAKATDQRLTQKTMFTAHGQVLGTLEYMSPEQARLNDLDVDTRSDIYSLGVVLYELLTGSTPLHRESLREAGFMEILNRIREEDPTRPSSRISESREALESISSVRQVEPRRLSAVVRGDLDWIVLKAMEKDRGRRYETASGFAADVSRFLKSEPIEARPASVAYRLKKTVQRNKAAVLSLFVVAVSLVAGTAISTWQAVRATRAEQESAARLIETRAALDSMSSLVIGDLLSQQTDVTPGMQALLEDALSMYQQFASETGNDRQTQAGVAGATYRVATIQRNLGIEDQGLGQFMAAAELYAALARDDPDELAYADQVVECRMMAGRSLIQAGDYSSAEEQLSLAEDALVRLRTTFGEGEAYFDNASAVRYYLSSVLRETGRDEEAVALLKTAISNQEHLIQLADGDPSKVAIYRGFLASMTQQVGLSLRHLGQHEQAKAAYTKAIGVLREVENYGPLNSNQQMRLGVLLNDLGVVYFKDREFGEAKSIYQQALAVRQRTLALYPNEIDHAACVGCTQLNLGNVARIQDQAEESLQHYADGIQVLERVRNRDPNYDWALGLLQACYRGRAESLLQLDQFKAAVTAIDNLEDVTRQRWPEDLSLPPRSQLRRAFALTHLDQDEAAAAIIERVLGEVRQFGDDYDLGEASYYIAAVYAAMARDDSRQFQDLAVRHLRTAIEHGYDTCGVKEVSFAKDPDFASLRDLPAFQKLRSQP